MARIVMSAKESSELTLSYIPAIAFVELEQIRVTGNQIRMFEDSINFLFSGTGFVTGGENTGVLDIVGGKITGLVGKYEGDTIFKVTGWNISAKALYDASQTTNENVLFDLMFGEADTVIGSKVADVIYGFGGGDVLRGNGGGDNILGGKGKDSLFGGKGKDVLSGDEGKDVLFGGAGADIFVFGEGSGGISSDRIQDFVHGVDEINLSSSLFTDVVSGDLPTTAFRIGKDAADANDRVIYDRATGKVYFDVDGLGGDDKIMFCQLDAGTKLTASDISIIS